MFGNTTLIDNDTCLTTNRSRTRVINIYEGIPDTILLNLVAWVLLISLFAILRNRAWDYGRLALVHTERWTQLFYKNTDDAIAAIEEPTADVSAIPDSGCMWFPSIFKITKERIYGRCGPEAAHYLSFQTHLLMLSAIICAFSMAVILPINFLGTLQGPSTSFGHTTIINLEPESKWLWVHVAASFAFVPLAILIMRRSSGRTPSATALTSRTIMITHISHAHRNADDIKNYLSVCYPDVEFRDVQMAYKVKKLMRLEKQRDLVREARMYCVMNHKPDLRVQPNGCIICCRRHTRNAQDFYTEEEERLTDLVIGERRRALEHPLGVAFVTVSSPDVAKTIIKSFEPGSIRHWLLTKAPSPSDINWENLEISSRNWYSKAIIINAILFFVLFFLTTPVIIVNIINNLTLSGDNFLKRISPLIADFIPTLLLLSLSALMPVMVAFTDQWMSHWTKSKQNHATMHKAFFFLLFMVLILPSLGLTSAQAFVEWSLQTKNITLRWECIFLADKGVLFINYVITSALIGTALELLRFPELAMYTLRLLRIKSEAEKTSIRKEILAEFPFGIHYAWTLLIFTITTVYSLTCPLITPFGLLYLSLKHFVDKYNIYYVYRPITMCGEGQQIHSDAVKMVRVSVFLLQLIMAAFAFIRGGLNAMSGSTLLGALVTGTSFFFLSPFPSCQTSKSLNRDNFPEMNEQYIAPVLLSTQNIERFVETEDGVAPTYGTSNTTNNPPIVVVGGGGDDNDISPVIEEIPNATKGAVIV